MFSLWVNDSDTVEIPSFSFGESRGRRHGAYQNRDADRPVSEYAHCIQRAKIFGVRKGDGARPFRCPAKQVFKDHGVRASIERVMNGAMTVRRRDSRNPSNTETSGAEPDARATSARVGMAVMHE